MSSDQTEWTFRVRGYKKNGEERDKTFSKINHALRYLWRIREAKEVYLEARDSSGKHKRMVLFLKLGRRRGINTGYAKVPPDRPSMKSGPEWQRLPSKFNDID